MYEYCMDCGKGFTSEWALTQHFIQSPRHLYCRFCDVHYREAYELHDHNSSRHGHCTVCSKLFETKEGLHQHSRQSHWYCDPCRQTFASQNNLNMHVRTSPAHNPRSNVCPGRNCGRSFMRYADLAAHLESGTCSGGFNRQNLNRMVVRADTSNIVTNPARLIGHREDSQVMNTWATPNSWNGYGYECALCHKEFRILSALNAHLNSPAHEARIYRCPTQYNGCAGEYRTLSALLSHIERSECGVARFRRPLTLALDNAMSGARRLTLN